MQFPHLKVIIPTAPVQPYTPLDGEVILYANLFWLWLRFSFNFICNFFFTFLNSFLSCTLTVFCFFCYCSNSVVFFFFCYSSKMNRFFIRIFVFSHHTFGLTDLQLVKRQRNVVHPWKLPMNMSTILLKPKKIMEYHQIGLSLVMDQFLYNQNFFFFKSEWENIMHYAEIPNKFDFVEETFYFYFLS